MVTFKNQVEVGKVVHIEDGKFKGKLAVIVNPISQKWVLIDGPSTGVPRQSVNIRTVRLTKFCVKICHHSPSRIIKEAFDKAEIKKKWAETSWAKQQAARAIRSSLNDFERFKVSHLKKMRSRIINKQCISVAVNKRKNKPAKK